MRENRKDLEQEIQSLIAQYVEESGKVEGRDNLGEEVYRLFDNIYFPVNLHAYGRSSTSALHLLAANNEIMKLFRDGMGDDEFEDFCDMLKSMAIFCQNLITSELDVARMDLIKWTAGDTSHMQVNDLIKEKMKYQRKLKNLKEDIQLRNK